MMPNITRGDRAGGLMVYLAGEGRHNEHEEPHLVAGDAAIMAWHDDAELSREDALAIARQVDEPRRTFGVEVPGGHVWHCSLSLAADEGQLSDEKWAAIAHDFVDEMGFSEASGKAACRWVAVRHGLSTAGNDHVHLAVSLVREDGTKASVWNDRKSAQASAGRLEIKHGLRVLESRQNGYGSRGVTPAEQAKTARLGAVEPERVTLGRQVRGYATAAADEAEFVRRCRRGGLLVRPRYASGRDDVVVGYSVAQRAPANDRPVWFGGGHLARDLTLPRLRAQWPDDPQAAQDAAGEWTAARRDRRPVQPGREAAEVDPQVWEKCHAGLADLSEKLRSVPIEDTDTWAQVARDTSGVFAAWSIQVETEPGPLADAADALSRFGQVRAHQVPVRRVPQPGVREAALLVIQGVKGSNGKTSQAILLRQLMNTLKALHDHQVAVGQVRAAAQVESAVREQLVRVESKLPKPPRTLQTVGAGVVEDDASKAARRAAELTQQGRGTPRPGSPLPTPLEPKKRRSTPGQGIGPDRGPEHGVSR